MIVKLVAVYYVLLQLILVLEEHRVTNLTPIFNKGPRRNSELQISKFDVAAGHNDRSQSRGHNQWTHEHIL